MANASKRKGSRIEREIVDLHRALGIEAERIPLSGAAGGSFTGDVRIAGLGTAEVKARAGGQGFATLERWLGTHPALFLRRDRAAPLVLLTWQKYAELLARNAVAPAGTACVIPSNDGIMDHQTAAGFAAPKTACVVPIPLAPTRAPAICRQGSLSPVAQPSITTAPAYSRR